MIFVLALISFLYSLRTTHSYSATWPWSTDPLSCPRERPNNSSPQPSSWTWRSHLRSCDRCWWTLRILWWSGQNWQEHKHERIRPDFYSWTTGFVSLLIFLASSPSQRRYSWSMINNHFLLTFCVNHMFVSVLPRIFAHVSVAGSSSLGPTQFGIHGLDPKAAFEWNLHGHCLWIQSNRLLLLPATTGEHQEQTNGQE